jgi:peptidoglycan/xylan/chitin deacetylase (PgdA/CDA1 family)
MTPVGGITAILSIIIILVRNTYVGIARVVHITRNRNDARKLTSYQRVLLSCVVLTLTVAAVSYSASIVLYYGSLEKNNLVLAHKLLYPCKPITLQPGTRGVILRLDDVQAYGWSDVSIKIMEDTLARNMPIMASVIPLHLETDSNITQFIEDNDCAIEIGIHGYDNITYIDPKTNSHYGEFALLDTETARNKIEKARSTISKYTKQPLKVFIPPDNQVSEGALTALQEEGLTIITSEGEEYFDYDAATYDFLNKTFIPASTVIQDCEAVFDRGDSLCVIMLHPQDFVDKGGSINTDRYAEYTKILDYLQSEKIPVLTFDEAAKRNMGMSPFTEDLSIGMTNPSVALLQKLLNEYGLTVALHGNGSAGNETDYFGNLTRDALTQFQVMEGIEPADGTLNATTRRKLTDRIFSTVQNTNTEVN